MNRMSTTTILAICAMLATPVLGYWEYDGTTSIIGGPSSGSGTNADGTGAWSAWADGNVTPGVTTLQASGVIGGEAWVQLYTYYQLGLDREAFGASRVEGTSSYHWVDDNTSKDISVTFFITVNDARIEYEGYALNYLGTSPATSSSTGYIQYGGNTTFLTYYPYGYGYGVADSEGGSNAYNLWGDVQATYDYANAWQYDDLGRYEGELVMAGTVDLGPYTDTPSGLSFFATSSLDGMAYAEGRIVVNDPDFHYGGFYAKQLTGSAGVLWSSYPATSLIVSSAGHTLPVEKRQSPCPSPPMDRQGATKEQTMRCKSALLIVLMYVLLGMGAAKIPDPGMPPGLRRVHEMIDANGLDTRQTAPIMNQVLNVSYRMADLSLAVREQVDFLLTPALLVQEAMSDNVVLTYPEE